MTRYLLLRIPCSQIGVKVNISLRVCLIDVIEYEYEYANVWIIYVISIQNYYTISYIIDRTKKYSKIREVQTSI